MLALMKFKTTALCLCLMNLFWACGPTAELPEPPNPNPAPELANRTVLAYVLADNSLTSFSLTDLDEMLEGIKTVDTKQNNLIVYMDRRDGGTSQLIRICRNSNGEIIKDTIQTYEASRNSVGINEMEQVFTYTVDHFPAQGYGLVLWSHGDGWIPYSNTKTRWIGQDENKGTMDKRLNIDELHTVLKSIPRLDFLLFDACYMQSIEVAYELRDCADYFIGSPTEIPGPGAPYQMVVPALFAVSAPETHTLSSSIASAYFDYYKNKYTGAFPSDDNWVGGVSMSVIQSNKLDALASATRELSIYSQPGINRMEILCYDPLRERNYYDMDQVMKATVGDTPAYQNWKRFYDAAVIYKETTLLNYNTYATGSGKMVSMDGFTGVSTYIWGSNSSYQSYYKNLLWYKATQTN